MENLPQIIQYIAIAFVPFMLGMICHEVAHGWVAYKMGDSTAKDLGRLTLNPVPHFEFLGTAMFFITAVASSLSNTPFIFGWAKPVPIDPRRFRNVRQGLFLVSIAGAAANIALAVGFALLTRLALNISDLSLGQVDLLGSHYLLSMCLLGVFVNLSLAVFNLLPIPPLDGSKVLGSLLPAPLAREFFRLERFGLIIVLILVATGVLREIVGPLVFGSGYFLLSHLVLS